jgi:hypothetical protein
MFRTVVTRKPDVGVSQVEPFGLLQRLLSSDVKVPVEPVPSRLLFLARGDGRHWPVSASQVHLHLPNGVIY